MMIKIGTQIINANKTVEVKFTDKQVLRYNPKETDEIYLNPDYVIATQVLKE